MEGWRVKGEIVEGGLEREGGMELGLVYEVIFDTYIEEGFDLPASIQHEGVADAVL
jgi:hypothetical protein